jgi:hypothetical protein
MQAYYDADRKVWVFPGDDPAELAKPIGPPPITPVSTDAALTPVVAVAPTPSNDPLEAMMLPPTRIPSAKRTRPQGFALSNNTVREGIIPPSVQTFSPPPNFAVFAAKPSVSGDQTIASD